MRIEVGSQFKSTKININSFQSNRRYQMSSNNNNERQVFSKNGGRFRIEIEGASTSNVHRRKNSKNSHRQKQTKKPGDYCNWIVAKPINFLQKKKRRESYYKTTIPTSKRSCIKSAVRLLKAKIEKVFVKIKKKREFKKAKKKKILKKSSLKGTQEEKKKEKKTVQIHCLSLHCVHP